MFTLYVTDLPKSIVFVNQIGISLYFGTWKENIMKKPPKTHLLDLEHDRQIPRNNVDHLLGYRGTACGYMRNNVALDPSRVNCKLCLKEMEKRKI